MSRSVRSLGLPDANAAGLQVIYYFRNRGGVYKFGWKKKPGIKAKGSLISN